MGFVRPQELKGLVVTEGVGGVTTIATAAGDVFNFNANGYVIESGVEAPGPDPIEDPIGGDTLAKAVEPDWSKNVRKR